MRDPTHDMDDLGAEEFGADLYRENLIDHYTRPRNQGELDPADIRFDGDNPSCGDRLTVTARVKDDRIAEIRFHGSGCAISQAAASMLFEDIVGRSLAEVDALGRQAVEELIGLPLRPARVKCGVLGLNSLKHGIKAYREPVVQRKSPPGFGGRRDTRH